MTGSKPRQLVLVRHGQSLLNVARAHSPVFFTSCEDRDRFANLPDHKVGLSEQGVLQAKETGKALKRLGFTFDVAYDSGYQRTIDTLDHILEAYSPEERITMRRKYDIMFREREGGYSYGMTRAEFEERYPWFHEYWKTMGPIFARPMGGESIADALNRVVIAKNTLFQECDGERVLFVTHGRILALMRSLLENWPPSELERLMIGHSPSNCGVTVYNYSEAKRKFELAEYNTCHW
jgi:2,3-bisphosphoglycerate-dependent phosphoglycerate mutase